MVTFNLFPWRERKAHYEAKKIKLIVITSLLMALLWHFLGYQYVLYQKNRIRLELIHMHKMEQNLIAQVQLRQPKLNQKHFAKQINQLKTKYQLLKKMLSELSIESKNDICFTEIRREANTISLTGNANSADALTEWLTHWNVSYFVSQIIIKHLKVNSATGFTEFNLIAIEK